MAENLNRYNAIQMCFILDPLSARAVRGVLICHEVSRPTIGCPVQLNNNETNNLRQMTSLLYRKTQLKRCLKNINSVHCLMLVFYSLKCIADNWTSA